MTEKKKQTEQERFLTYLEIEKDKGLVDIKLYPAITSVASTEDIYAELNDMNHAIQSGRFEKITNL